MKNPAPASGPKGLNPEGGTGFDLMAEG